MRPASSDPLAQSSRTRSGAQATSARTSKRSSALSPLEPAPEAAPVRAQRQRKAKTVYSPTAADQKQPPRKTALKATEADGKPKKRVGRPRKVPIATPGASSAEDESAENVPVYATLAAKIRAQVTKLRYHLAFVEAYEAEGWRRASREKIKPSKELEAANGQILARKHIVVETLHALRVEYKQESPLAFLVASGQGDIPSDQIICSRCNSTDTVEDNDILLCDNIGCQRAYHQQCQSPVVRTEAIPQGDELWYCQICLAIFNSLKIINSAFGTMYETIDEVFPELKEAELASEEKPKADQAEDDGDEEDDGDFVEGEDEDVEDVEEDGDSDTAHSSSGDESAISDGELAYLKKDSVVIDSNTRSVRSRVDPKPASTDEAGDVVGRTVAKIDSSTYELVFGVVRKTILQPQWQVTYANGTTELLTQEQMTDALALAAQSEPPSINSTQATASEPLADQEPEEQGLIIPGKRKRTPVDYRKLNDMLYAGEQDSDLDETYEEGADDNAEQDNDDDSDDYKEGDDSPLPPASTKSPKRKGRRVQNKDL